MKLSEVNSDVMQAIINEYPGETIEEVIQWKHPTYVFPIYAPEHFYFDPNIWFVSEEIKLEPSRINPNILLGKYKTRVVFKVIGI